MKRKKVESSSLASIGYNKKTKTLEIEFNHGSIYAYYDVDEKTYEDLMNADSHGRYFNNSIRDDYDSDQLQ